jgi:uncharacterized membrane protein YidH (DUF202 family)
MIMEIKDESSEIFNSVSLLLAEKRTSLSVLRTAIALFTVPTSVFTILVATSRYYDLNESLYFAVPLFLLCFFLIFFGLYLVIRSLRRLHAIDRKIQEIKEKDTCLREIIKDA